MNTEKFETPGWCRNLIGAGRVQPGECVLVVVDEPLAEEGSELAAAVRDAGGEPQLELWVGERPLAEPPQAVSEAAAEAGIYFFLAREPRPDEAGARIALSEISRASLSARSPASMGGAHSSSASSTGSCSRASSLNRRPS